MDRKQVLFLGQGENLTETTQSIFSRVRTQKQSKSFQNEHFIVPTMPTSDRCRAYDINEVHIGRTEEASTCYRRFHSSYELYPNCSESCLICCSQSGYSQLVSLQFTEQFFEIIQILQLHLHMFNIHKYIYWIVYIKNIFNKTV